LLLLVLQLLALRVLLLRVLLACKMLSSKHAPIFRCCPKTKSRCAGSQGNEDCFTQG